MDYTPSEMTESEARMLLTGPLPNEMDENYLLKGLLAFYKAENRYRMLQIRHSYAKSNISLGFPLERFIAPLEKELEKAHKEYEYLKHRIVTIHYGLIYPHKVEVDRETFVRDSSKAMIDALYEALDYIKEYPGKPRGCTGYKFAVTADNESSNFIGEGDTYEKAYDICEKLVFTEIARWVRRFTIYADGLPEGPDFLYISPRWQHIFRSRDKKVRKRLANRAKYRQR